MNKLQNDNTISVSQKRKKVILVGHPNVGKSLLFNRLTGSYAGVSNYPGTTVEIFEGSLTIDENHIEIIDTPGMYSFMPVSEEERVARDIILNGNYDQILHVIDGKNIDRMLPLTLQLIETGIPVILICNMMDEVKREGIEIDTKLLSRKLNIPVIETISTSGKGIDRIKNILLENVQINSDFDNCFLQFSSPIEDRIEEVTNYINIKNQVSKRSYGLTALHGDEEFTYQNIRNPNDIIDIEIIINDLEKELSVPVEYAVAVERQRAAEIILENVIIDKKKNNNIIRWLDKLMVKPITGIPILLGVLYLGIYKLVGGVGAGVIVDFLEGTIFEEIINPYITDLVTSTIPWEAIQQLFVGDYGVITLGLRYAVALILPIVTIFFLVFSVIEDSGYLPRLALLIDRTFKRIGLSGRAVIPMVLGFGCATMATLVTRTLPSKRERIIGTMLLALAVPCSAQLGVILGLLSGNYKAALIWAGTISLIFLLIGFLAKLVIPGENPIFYMELPPLRVPKFKNVITKTYVRVKWYFKEILPIFLFASIFIWLGQITGIFNTIITVLHYPVRALGLPLETARVFLFGFFRRDYGTAGLYDLHNQGLINGNELVIAAIAVTLFLPCIAQFLMTVKERGWKTGVAISLFVLAVSFIAAFAVSKLFIVTGVTI